MRTLPQLLWLLTLVLLVPGVGATPNRPVDELDDLVKLVADNEDKVDIRVFEKIASPGTEESFRALRKVVGYLRKDFPLRRAYMGFRHFIGKGKLEKQAIDFVFGDAKAHRREENQRAATLALVTMGQATHDKLEWILTRHKDEACRRVAVQPLLPRLGEQGDVDAAELILDYASIKGGPAHQAVLDALRKCKDEDSLDLFTRRLRNGELSLTWKLLLLEVVASHSGRDVDKMLYARLDDDAPEVRTRAIELLGERKVRSAIGKIRNHLRSDDAAELQQAIVTIGRLIGYDEDWEDELFDFARSKKVAARMGATVALAELRTAEAIKSLHHLLADPDWRVRAEALQQVGNIRRKDSLPILIARLDQESGRLRRDLATTLRLFTGLDHGTRTTRWRRWWDAEGEAYELPTYEAALAAEDERLKRSAERPTTVTFYGLEVVSDRVAFVLDVSGSMSTPAGSAGNRTSTDGRTGPTRLAVAKHELKGALKTLSPSVLFNIVFFQSGVFPWQDELRELTDDMRADAVTFVDKQRAGGGTNVYDALIAAFDDPRIDTIYLLTDGDPTAGTVTDPATIRERIARVNRTRKIQIHCIAIGKGSPFLEKLAEENGGTYRASL